LLRVVQRPGYDQAVVQSLIRGRSDGTLISLCTFIGGLSAIGHGT
jgi:hypothetical protein